MRTQFHEAIRLLCTQRTKQSPHIRWWFSQLRGGVYRAGFRDEVTLTMGDDVFYDQSSYK